MIDRDQLLRGQARQHRQLRIRCPTHPHSLFDPRAEREHPQPNFRTLLEEAWASGPTAYLSVAIPGFPNLFLLNGPNGPVGNFSLIQVAELQMGYILHLVELLRDGTAAAIAARADAAAAFELERVDAAQRTVWVTGCNSWYLDAHGVPAAWPWKFQRFRDVMTAPDLSAFELL